MHANQCAISANVDINNNNTAAPYSEYRSNLRATRTNRSKRAVLSKPISVVVYKLNKIYKSNFIYEKYNIIFLHF